MTEFKHASYGDDTTINPSRVTLPDGRRSKVTEDGVFEVPDEFADYYRDETEHEEVGESPRNTEIEDEDEANEAYVLTEEVLEETEYDQLVEYASQFDSVDGRLSTEELREELEGRHVKAEEESDE